MLDLGNINVHTICVKADLCAVFWYLSQPVNDISAECVIFIRRQFNVKFIAYLGK